MMDKKIREVALAVQQAKRVLFITGAGMSADSGLPTYRGVGGLYNRGATDEGPPIEVMLSGPMFQRDPGATWKYIREIENACRGAEPNAGHHYIAELQRDCEVCVLTQNVDGLHRTAGSENLIEIHGCLNQLRCTSCDWTRTVEDYSQLPGLPELPQCPDCEALVRPAVVLFEEMLPVQALRHLEDELARGFDLIFSIGTTAGFPYIFEPVQSAVALGIDTVEINPAPTVLSDSVRWQLSAGAADTLSRIGQCEN